MREQQERLIKSLREELALHGALGQEQKTILELRRKLEDSQAAVAKVKDEAALSASKLQLCEEELASLRQTQSCLVPKSQPSPQPESEARKSYEDPEHAETIRALQQANKELMAKCNDQQRELLRSREQQAELLRAIQERETKFAQLQMSSPGKSGNKTHTHVHPRSYKNTMAQTEVSDWERCSAELTKLQDENGVLRTQVAKLLEEREAQVAQLNELQRQCSLKRLLNDENAKLEERLPRNSEGHLRPPTKRPSVPSLSPCNDEHTNPRGFSDSPTVLENEGPALGLQEHIEIYDHLIKLYKDRLDCLEEKLQRLSNLGKVLNQISIPKLKADMLKKIVTDSVSLLPIFAGLNLKTDYKLVALGMAASIKFKQQKLPIYKIDYDKAQQALATLGPKRDALLAQLQSMLTSR